jgi:N-hydroxyarylamine O-acetyltransferase
MKKLQAYLDRIGFKGSARPDLATLRAVHRSHVEAIPYENLDVQLRRAVTRSPADAFEKIVTRRRGGWCYEMNGLLGWALEEIGFKVTRLAGAVTRDVNGDGVIGNHLVLIVDLGDLWIADAGFGDGLIEPTPLREGAFRVGPLDCSLERVEGGWWRYNNDPSGGAPTFDFHLDVSDEALLEARCRFLQTDPASPFVMNAVVQCWRNNEHHSMRGRVLQTVDGIGKRQRMVDSAEEYVAMLRERFALDLPEAASLWPAILARHHAVMAEKRAASA